MAEHIFTLEAEGDERIWRQMNVHLHLYSYDAEGTSCGVVSADNDAKANHKSGKKLSRLPRLLSAYMLFLGACPNRIVYRIHLH